MVINLVLLWLWALIMLPINYFYYLLYIIVTVNKTVFSSISLNVKKKKFYLSKI